MKKPRSFTRKAASLLLIPIFHIGLTVLFFEILFLNDLVMPDYMSNFLYRILFFIAAFIPQVTVVASMVGISLSIQGIRKGENKTVGILVISACILFIVLLVAACIAIMWYLISIGGIGS